MHRADAFAACEFLMDALKTTAPLWKRELADGKARWLEPRDEDAERLADRELELQRGTQNQRKRDKEYQQQQQQQ